MCNATYHCQKLIICYRRLLYCLVPPFVRRRRRRRCRSAAAPGGGRRGGWHRPLARGGFCNPDGRAGDASELHVCACVFAWESPPAMAVGTHTHTHTHTGIDVPSYIYIYTAHAASLIMLPPRRSENVLLSLADAVEAVV